LIANKNGAITGLLTSPYELGRIDDALFLGRE
jgi:translation initiation factor 6 (eIF-6)